MLTTKPAPKPQRHKDSQNQNDKLQYNSLSRFGIRLPNNETTVPLIVSIYFLYFLLDASFACYHVLRKSMRNNHF